MDYTTLHLKYEVMRYNLENRYRRSTDLTLKRKELYYTLISVRKLGFKPIFIDANNQEMRLEDVIAKLGLKSKHL